MKTLKSKYKQGDLKNRWKVQQCRCEKDYFDYHKDCEHCEAKEYCYSEQLQPYFINVTNSMLIFADNYDNAKEYAGQGHGWLLDRESVEGMPVQITIEDGKVSFRPDVTDE